MELPFLYLTRTILRPGKRSLKLTRHSSPTTTTTRSRCLHQQVQDETQDRTSFFREKAEAVAAKSGPRERSTITWEEQKAFYNLRRLAEQMQRPSHQADVSQDTNLLNLDPRKILALFTPTPTSTTGNDAEINRISEEYMLSVSDEFKQTLQASSTRGDLMIWNVLRRRVFPLLTFLKDQNQISQNERHAAEIALPIAKSLFRKNKNALQPANELKASANDNSIEDQSNSSSTQPMLLQTSAPSTASPLPILTRIYPSSLLLALRLLSRHHPLSTLTPSLLPHIRSLGSSSYVLGTNTHFYNTLLFLRWNTHSSLRELCDLLGEMERGAVEFDRGTYRVLRYVADERWNDLMQQESHGTPAVEYFAEQKLVLRGKQWWMRPEQAQWWPKVEKWRTVIAKKLEEKGMGEVIREGPSGNANAPGWETEQRMPGVWL